MSLLKRLRSSGVIDGCDAASFELSKVFRALLLACAFELVAVALSLLGRADWSVLGAGKLFFRSIAATVRRNR